MRHAVRFGEVHFLFRQDRIGERRVEDEDDLMTGLPFVREQVFDHPEELKVPDVDVDLLLPLAANRVLRPLEEVNATAQAAIEQPPRRSFDAVLDEDPAVPHAGSNRDRSNSVFGHLPLGARNERV